jgi:hypothetical protein
MSTTFHPQSNGQSKSKNNVITMYLRCLTGDQPRYLLQWLPWADFYYNSAYHASICTSPFHVIFGLDPPVIWPYESGTAWVPAVAQQLTECDEFLVEICDHLEQAQ